MEELHSSRATPDQWAVRWIKALPGADYNVRAAFATWIRHSARYTEAYLRQKMLDEELRGLDPQHRVNVEELIARARARLHADGKVVPWPHQVTRRPSAQAQSLQTKSPSPPKLGVLAVIFTISALMSGPQILLHRSIEHRSYSTARGEQRSIKLPDGSTATLNTQSQLQVDFSPLRREVKLLHGEALFAVRHNPRNPFRVRAGATVVEDVGTVFDVRVDSAGATVAVSEGQVMLQRRSTHQSGIGITGASQDDPPMLLAQNDAAFVPDVGTPAIMHNSPGRLAALTAWTKQLVLLDDMPLADAVRELNRYNPIQLQLADPQAGQLRLGGSFDLREPLVFVASLRALGCHITAEKQETIWISRCAPSQVASPPGAGPPQ